MGKLTIYLSEEKMKRLREVAAAQKKSVDDLVEEAIDYYLAALDSMAARQKSGESVGSLKTTD